jgi:hypothetical protein
MPAASRLSVLLYTKAGKPSDPQTFNLLFAKNRYLRVTKMKIYANSIDRCTDPVNPGKFPCY